MHILSIGINHTTAPIRLRERLALGATETCAPPSNLQEAVLLSTCNRTEIYAVSGEGSFADLQTFLAAISGVPLDEFRRHLHCACDEAAIAHLFRVTAGLESLVLGEAQILGQVTRALEKARSQNTVGPLLSRLFQDAIHAGKRVRAETAISRNPASVSSLAAALCQRSVQDIRSAQVVILGAGETAELAVEALRKRGAQRLTVINRSAERAQALAARWNAQAGGFGGLPAILADADILIASTAAPQAVLDAETVAAAMSRRPGRPLVLIDIAVPRNIDPQAAQIPHVRLHDLDGLNASLEKSLAGRIAEVPRVEAILDEEIAKFMDYFGALDVLPLISDMRRQAEAIRRSELEKTLRRLPGLGEAEREHIEALTQALVKKLLDKPTRQLRAEAPEYAPAARALFGI